MNMIIKEVIILIVHYMRKKSQTIKITKIFNFIFCCQFLNTAILLLMSNANLENSHIPILSRLFHGKFADFNQEWYNITGNLIVETMMINSMMPVFMAIMGYFLEKLF